MACHLVACHDDKQLMALSCPLCWATLLCIGELHWHSVLRKVLESVVS